MKCRSVLYRCEPLLNVWRVQRLRCLGVELASGCRVESGLRVRLGVFEGRSGSVSIGRGCTLSQGAVFDCWGGSVVVGENVFVGPYAVIYGHGGVTIGAHTLISMHCSIIAANHSIPPKGKRFREEPDLRAPVVIGEDVWLGAGVKVLAGVTIGDGCAVGAGAVVTEDLPPYCVAAGVPAKVIRQRE